MKKVLAPEIGTVEAPPERVRPEKLGPVAAHEVTPFEFQKIYARVPRRTDAGSDHISTSGCTLVVCAGRVVVDCC